jgi:hypothetical protein
MQTGAFALIDALGFKGIWKKYGEEQILAKLEKMAKDNIEYFAATNDMPGPVGAPGLMGSIRVAFLSDTIAMAAEVGAELPPGEQTGETVEGRAIGWLVIHLSKLLRDAAMTDPPLAYRGCVSFGEFAVRDRFILGPAVDSAAALERLAEGAFVWLDPTARAIVEGQGFRWGKELPEDHDLHRFRVPLKSAQSFDTYAVLPFGPGHCSRAVVIDRMLSSFDDSSFGVVMKKDNTRSFLQSGAQASERAFERKDRTDRFMSRVTDRG